MPLKDPTPGTTATAEMRVTHADLASSLELSKDDKYLSVFATARMIALMEVAAARILVPILTPIELSVGAHVSVAHSAATPPGSKVVAHAKYVRSEPAGRGKVYVFEVTARDEAGEIGKGEHRRAVVESSRLLKGAEKRRMVIEKERGKL